MSQTLFKKNPLFIYYLIGIIITFNLILAYRLYENKSILTKLENHSNALILNYKGYESYIKQSLGYDISIFENFVQMMHSYDSTVYTHDSAFIILLPQEACYTCISDLFIELRRLQVDPNSTSLFMETSNKQLQREWISNNFKFYKVDTKNIFQSLNLKENIVTLKIINNKVSNILFRTNIITTELLSIFFNKHNQL